jgi:2-isopropylmalate synthase
LVFTAFSGSHQDAIKKSWPHQKADRPWDVLYIPIDPADIGRSYKAIIRINSQSGKGGVAYVLENDFGYQLPKLMHKEIGKIINDLADSRGAELPPQDIHDMFIREYIDRASPVTLRAFTTLERTRTVTCQSDLLVHGEERRVTGAGNGPIDAFVQSLRAAGLPAFELLSYSEHSLGSGAEARAVSYIQIKTGRGATFFGAGIDTNIELASIKAVVSALNRSLAKA